MWFERKPWKKFFFLAVYTWSCPMNFTKKGPQYLFPIFLKYFKFMLSSNNVNCYLKLHVTDVFFEKTYYRQTRPHDFATGSQSVVNSAQRQKSNKLIMMGAIAFMLIGATVQYFFIRYMIVSFVTYNWPFCSSWLHVQVYMTNNL